MASDDRTAEMPLIGVGQASFDTTMRGYDRRQVDDYVADLEAEIGELRASRDQLSIVSAERAAMVAAQEGRIESLKQAVAQAKPAGPDQVEVIRQARTEAQRILTGAETEAQRVLTGAETEAQRMVTDAETEAERVLSGARADAEETRLAAATEQQRLVSAAAQRLAEADQKAAQSRVQSITELDAARTEAGRMLQIATDQRDYLDAQAQAARELAERISTDRRQLADDDFEITLRARRTRSQQQEREQSETTEQTIADMLAAARDQVDQLHQHRDHVHADLQGLHNRLGTVISDTDW